MPFDYQEILTKERPMTTGEVEMVHKLRARGLTHREIAERLGRSRKTVSRYLDEDNPKPNKYTPEEVELLLELYGKGLMPSEIAEYLPRHSAGSISWKLREYGCRSGPRLWTDEEKEIMVRMLVRGATYKQIGDKLGRSARAVEAQNLRRRKRAKEDKRFQAATKALEFCFDPVRVLKAVRDSQIVPHLLEEDVDDEEIMQLVATAKRGW